MGFLIIILIKQLVGSFTENNDAIAFTSADSHNYSNLESSQRAPFLIMPLSSDLLLSFRR
jgi:hypothetical protein